MGDWADDEERRRDAYEGMSKEEYEELSNENGEKLFDMPQFMDKHYDQLDNMKFIRSIKEQVLRKHIEPIHTAISEIGKKLEQIRQILGLHSRFCEKVTKTADKSVKQEIKKRTRMLGAAKDIQEEVEEAKNTVHIEGEFKKKKILIGTPICSDKMYSWEEYVKAVKGLKRAYGMMAHVLVVATNNDADMEEKIKNEGFLFGMVRGNKAMDRLVHARNYILSYAEQWNYDAVFFIDSDVIVPQNTLTQLMNHHKDIVAGFYPITTGLGFPIPHAKLLVKDTYRPLPEDMINDKLQEVDLVGMGCTLISRIMFPFKFCCERGPYGDLRKSEDMCYCEQIREQGIFIFFDPTLTCKHKIGGDGNHWDPATS